MSASTTARAPSTSRSVPLLLAPKQLNELLQANAASLRILDATWFMPNVSRNAAEEFAQGPRIPQARFWNVDQVATLKGEVDETGKEANPLGLSHMMPTAKRFADAAQDQGITPETHVVVYDTHGVFSSPRTAFTFHAFGHPAVSILNGGLPAWRAAGLPLEEGPVQHPKDSEPVQYPTPTLQTTLIRSYDEMVANARMGARSQTVLDARPAGRFAGTAPEPRAGMSSGHIPHSLSLPATNLLQTQTDPNHPQRTFTVLKEQTDLWRTLSDSLPGGMEDLDKLRQASSAGEPAATNTCGSGMTAAILWLGLRQLGIESSIYDESWSGYAQRKESVIDRIDE